MANFRDRIASRFNINISDNADKVVVQERDLDLLRTVLPNQIKTFSKYTQIGEKYVAVFLVNTFPNEIRSLAFTDLFNKPGNTVTMDWEVGQKSTSVEEIEKSIDELETRYVVNQHASENRNDAYELRNLLELHARLQQTAEQMAYITLRFILYADTPQELDKKRELLEADLKVNGLAGGIPEFEQLPEYRSLTNSANTQRQAIPIQTTLRDQFPFYFQSHKDPHGILWGVTLTNGLVLLDTFRVAGDRMSFDLAIIGKKGSGKSTLLKYLTQIHLAFGNKILATDLDGEMIAFTKAIGGRVIRPTDPDNRSNPLELHQVYSPKFEEDGSGADEASIISSNFMAELSRVIGWFYQLFPKMTDTESSLLKTTLTTTYRNKGITAATPLNHFVSTDFPRMRDLLQTVQDDLYSVGEDGKKHYRASLSEETRALLEALEIKIKPYTHDEMYGPLFDVYSTIDVSEEKFVVFDMSLTSEFERNVYNALVYSQMGFMWTEVYKNRVKNEGLPVDDRHYVICEFDEAHKSINTNNPKALDFVEKMVRRDRKYDAALWFASQQPRDFAPSGDGENLDKIKNIFGMVQYKVLMQQDESDYDVLQKLFPQFTRSEIESTAIFQKGEHLLSMGAGAKIRCTNVVPPEYLEYFGGGR